jgi:hypothetical protein
MADIPVGDPDESGEEDQRDTHPRTEEKKKKENDGFNLPSMITGLIVGFVAAFISFVYAVTG